MRTDRDARMNTLRQKWFSEFRKVLGTKLAVRAMQIDRRLSLAHQVQFVAHPARSPGQWRGAVEWLTPVPAGRARCSAGPGRTRTKDQEPRTI